MQLGEDTEQVCNVVAEPPASPLPDDPPPVEVPTSMYSCVPAVTGSMVTTSAGLPPEGNGGPTGGVGELVLWPGEPVRSTVIAVTPAGTV